MKERKPLSMNETLNQEDKNVYNTAEKNDNNQYFKYSEKVFGYGPPPDGSGYYGIFKKGLLHGC